jgi:flavin reductase (DIM6/NTAB) family NADH-FMN oxidoreductase RutF
MAVSFNLAADPAPDHAPIADFVDAMSTFASGVVIVTCRVGDRPWGMTVTAFASVSAHPPTVLVALDADARSAEAITRTRRFGVSILAAEQVAVARFGAANGASKFLEKLTRLGDDDSPTPAVAGALAHLECDVAQVVSAGTHTVFFGRVRAAHSARDGLPLVYHSRGYRTVVDLEYRHE